MFANNSNVEIVELASHTTSTTTCPYPTTTQKPRLTPQKSRPNTRGPTVQKVSIPPRSDQMVSTTTCTPTPPPTNARGYSLNSGRPNITYRWPEGSHGTIDF